MATFCQHKKSAVIFGLRGAIAGQFVTRGGVKSKKPQQRNIEHNNKRLDEFYVRDKVVSRISWSHIQ